MVSSQPERRRQSFLKLDFANAFNTVNRQAFITEVRNRFPSLAPWVEFCYSSPSQLVFGSHIISSETGVQRGDPFGPLLFVWSCTRFCPRLLAFAQLEDLSSPTRTLMTFAWLVKLPL